VNCKIKIKSEKVKIKSERKKNQTQKVKRYNDPAFIKYRTKTFATAISETANTNSIAVFKQQIYNLSFLSFYDSDYAFRNNLAILDRIIDFVERSKSLLDLKYTEDVWYIMAELYKLKSMITNHHIYSTDEAKKEAYEIMQYANEHLL